MNRCKIAWLAVALFSLINSFPAEAEAEKRIGVLLWSEESRYGDVAEGVMDQLNNDGFGESAVKFTQGNARGSKAQLTELVRKFAAAKMDLIVTVGTTATISATAAIKDVPVVFAYVYDPVETGIAKGWKGSGNNTTGASSKVPMAKLVNSLREFAQVKRLAVLYTPGEKN